MGGAYSRRQVVRIGIGGGAGLYITACTTAAPATPTPSLAGAAVTRLAIVMGQAPPPAKQPGGTPNMQATPLTPVSVPTPPPKPTQPPPKSVVMPTPQPKPTSVPPPPPPKPTSTIAPRASAIDVRVTQYNSFANTIGATVVQGLVRNGGPGDAGAIEIAVSLLGAGDAVVGAGQAIIKPGMLKAGAQAPWMASIAGAPAGVRVIVQVQAQPLTGLLAALNTSYQDLAVDGVTVLPPALPFTWPRLAGRVRNTGTKRVALISLIVAVFAANGAVDVVDATSPSLSGLAPGQATPFEFAFLVSGKQIARIGRYEIFAEGMPQA